MLTPKYKTEARAIGQRVGEAVRRDAIETKRYEAARAEARRLAGASAAAEDVELVSGADGVPGAAKKTFQH
jgi:hypothetical protein